MFNLKLFYMKEYDINEVIRLRDEEKLKWKEIE